MAESPANPQPMVRQSPRFLAQVKAFLSYIEDVEVDEEIIEDVLTGLEEEFDSFVTSDGEQPDAEPDTRSGNGTDDEQGEDEDEFAQEGSIHYSTIWLLEGLIWSSGFSQRCVDRGRGQTDHPIFETTRLVARRHPFLKPFTLVFVRRNEGIPRGVRDRAPNPDRSPPLRIRHIAGKSVVFEFPIGAQQTAKCKELRQKQPKTQLYFLKVVIFQV